MINNHKVGYTYYKDLRRESEGRKSPQQVTEWLQNPKCRILPCYQGKPMAYLKHDGTWQATLIPVTKALTTPQAPLFFLGILNNETPIFTLTIADEQLLAGIQGQAVNLREVSSLLSEAESNLMLYAQGLIYWHSQNGYCSKCGKPTKVEEAGHLRTCTNDACKRLSYPRINPAVIVLIEGTNAHGEPMCLLARHHRYSPPEMMSTLAGFVEMGESLEETVRREMLEEAGIHVEDIRYITSQPWPFPSSLMLGFRAKAINTNITLDENELTAAQWFTSIQMRQAIGSGELLPSRPDSIARYLIMGWLEEQV